MWFAVTILMLQHCISFGGRVWAIILSVIIVCLGGWLLAYSRAGKLKSMNCAGVLVKGEDAKLCSTIFAIALLLIGVFILLAMVFKLDC